MVRNLEVTETNVRNLVCGTLYYLQEKIDEKDEPIVAATCFIHSKHRSIDCTACILVSYDSATLALDLNFKSITKEDQGYMLWGETPIEASRLSAADMIVIEATGEFYKRMKSLADKYATDNILEVYSELMDLNAEYCITRDGRIEKIEKG